VNCPGAIVVDGDVTRRMQAVWTRLSGEVIVTRWLQSKKTGVVERFSRGVHVKFRLAEDPSRRGVKEWDEGTIESTASPTSLVYTDCNSRTVESEGGLKHREVDKRPKRIQADALSVVRVAQARKLISCCSA
jgi:hypothetical protein